MSTATATPKQVQFLRKLIEDRSTTLGIDNVDSYIEAHAITRLSVRDISKVIDSIKNLPADPKPEHAHLPVGHVIVNKREGLCPLCGETVDIGSGYAVHTANGWRNYHKLSECPTAFECTVPAGRYALPSTTGNNDLDFFRVSESFLVHRVIGGHADQRLSGAQARAVLERLQVLSPDELRSASALFGRELGYCGKCGRHLTDEASRSLGFGPDCANSF